ncbi:MAG: hypothetical protein GY718_09670 [Lentisphaerae bacterium]|nr:hypothetical protein [Lentisphaerota bacterium]
MPKVKKYTKGGMYVINFGEALAEILWHNYHPILTKKNEEIVRQQLLTEVRVNTQTAAYYLMENLDDLRGGNMKCIDCKHWSSSDSQSGICSIDDTWEKGRGTYN